MVERIPNDVDDMPCKIGENDLVLLEFLIDDYLNHMQQHLQHILKT